MNKYLFGLVLCLLLASCQLEKELETLGPVEETTTYSIDGAIQKGPFQTGSKVTVQEVDRSLDPTGRMYITTTIDDFGSFTLASKFSSQYVEVTSEGYYFNECTNVTAGSMISLRSYGDLSLSKPLNLNVLTTIAHGRIKKLIEEGKVFSEARNQAESELLALLGFSPVLGLHFYEFSLASGGNDAALLLAVSATLQQGRSVAQVSQYLADLQLDFADDGTITNTELIAQLRTSSAALNVNTVMNNLKTHYKNRGKAVEVPDFSLQRNVLQVAGGVISKPVFSLNSGTYIEEKALTITAPAGAEIRYTIDGSTPTLESSIYTSPIALKIGSTITLKAISILNNVVSEVSTASYIIKNGRLAKDYWVSRPGYYIEYNYNGRVNDNNSQAKSYKVLMTFQKGALANNYFASLYSTDKNWGKSYLIGSFLNSGFGFTGNTGYRLGSIIYRLSLLPATVIEGETFNLGGSNTTVLPSFTATFDESWGDFNDVIKVTFDSKNYSSTLNTSIGPYIRGEGKIIYARGIGIVHFELTHSEGLLQGTTDTMTAVKYGDAPLVTYIGKFTDAIGNPRYGVTIEPINHAFGILLPTDSSCTINDSLPFELKQYIVPGSYSALVAVDGNGTQLGEYSFLTPDNTSTIEVGDLRQYIAP